MLQNLGLLIFTLSHDLLIGISWNFVLLLLPLTLDQLLFTTILIFIVFIIYYTYINIMFNIS
jgi:hypothetical protein